MTTENSRPELGGESCCPERLRRDIRGVPYVTRDVEYDTIVVGNPARVIRHIETPDM